MSKTVDQILVDSKIKNILIIYYFLRNDTIDSKILNKYGVFVHRNNPDLVYIKSNKKALESFNEDFNKMTDLSNQVPSMNYLNS